MNELEMPAMLYKRDGTMLDWDGKMWDTIIVADEEDLEIALANGWQHPADAIKPDDDKPEAARRGRPPKDKGE